MTTMTANMTGGEHCRWCDDEGWVELKGTVTVHGQASSRGSAPCKWCETGAKRWQRMQQLRIDGSTDKAWCHATDRHAVETNYTEADVDAQLDYQPASKVEAGQALAAIQAQWSQPRAVDQAARGESRAQVEAKREQAQRALEQGDGTVELPADPAPTQPDYSEVPF